MLENNYFIVVFKKKIKMFNYLRPTEAKTICNSHVLTQKAQVDVMEDIVFSLRAWNFSAFFCNPSSQCELGRSVAILVTVTEVLSSMQWPYCIIADSCQSIFIEPNDWEIFTPISVCFLWYHNFCILEQRVWSRGISYISFNALEIVLA